jgi:hypothetical protein
MKLGVGSRESGVREGAAAGGDLLPECLKPVPLLRLNA